MGDVHTNTIEGFWSLVKGGIRIPKKSSRFDYELIEALSRASQHERDVIGVEADALGLAGSARCIDDGH